MSPKPAPGPVADHTAPRLRVALTPTTPRRLRVKLTLGERATVTMTVKRGRLHRGDRITLTVRARDAAGNTTTRRVTAKVR